MRHGDTELVSSRKGVGDGISKINLVVGHVANSARQTEMQCSLTDIDLDWKLITMYLRFVSSVECCPNNHQDVDIQTCIPIQCFLLVCRSLSYRTWRHYSAAHLSSSEDSLGKKSVLPYLPAMRQNAVYVVAL